MFAALFLELRKCRQTSATILFAAMTLSFPQLYNTQTISKQLRQCGYQCRNSKPLFTSRGNRMQKSAGAFKLIRRIVSLPQISKKTVATCIIAANAEEKKNPQIWGHLRKFIVAPLCI